MVLALANMGTHANQLKNQFFNGNAIVEEMLGGFAVGCFENCCSHTGLIETEQIMDLFEGESGVVQVIERQIEELIPVGGDICIADLLNADRNDESTGDWKDENISDQVPREIY